MTVFRRVNSSGIQIRDAKLVPGMDFVAGPHLPPMRFADFIRAVTKLRARLSAIRAFQAIDFQTRSDSVIFLDLTRIIAFDAVREWEAARRLRCGIPGMGWNGSCVHTGKRSGFA